MIASFNRVDAGVRFEIEGKYTDVDDGNHWIGVGLSLDGGSTFSMGDDSVIACYGPTIANYWNTPSLYSLPLDVSDIDI